VSLAFAKSVENMELGHNIGHGLWDWMNAPEIHSNTWEWDMAGLSSQWRYSHNYRHHVFTNVLGKDDDLGVGILRDLVEDPGRLHPAVGKSRLGSLDEPGLADHLVGDDERASGALLRELETRRADQVKPGDDPRRAVRG